VDIVRRSQLPTACKAQYKRNKVRTVNKGRVCRMGTVCWRVTEQWRRFTTKQQELWSRVPNVIRVSIVFQWV